MKKQNNVNVETFTLSDNQELIIKGKQEMKAYGFPFFLAYIPLKEVLTNLGYQRETNPARVRHIIKNFDPEKVDVKCVNYRPDEDIFACTDGCHTFTALYELGYEYMPCKVFIGKTYEEEALFFSAQNKGVKKTSTVEEFKALLEAQDPDTVTIHNIMKRWGCELSPIAGVNKIRSIRKLTKIFSENVLLV